MLLTLAAGGCLASYAQEGKSIQAFAITGPQKGSSAWTEVRSIDLSSGAELQSVYQSKQESAPLNARTGKAIAPTVPAKTAASDASHVTLVRKDANGNTVTVVRSFNASYNVSPDAPFATSSAALAYDKKHNRLYYTPMGIAQLRYIDLKTGKIYYFEGENFGVLKGRHDVASQITRMVIASDGNGYALTNDANHLIRFTTGKKPEITDLGALTDDAGNSAFSVHSREGFGGDIVADVNKNLYLLTANRSVFKISIETRQASFLGTVRGLPKGFTTNGAAVEEGSKIIVTSSAHTVGYFRVDLNTLQAERVSAEGQVFNASDLANGNLLFDKKKKKDKEVKEEPIAVTPQVKEEGVAGRPVPTTVNDLVKSSISVFPNPVSTGTVKLSFNDQPAGRYNIQFLDVTGKTLSQQQVTINAKTQVVDYTLPRLIASGNYLIKVTNEANEVSAVNKLVVQQ